MKEGKAMKKWTALVLCALLGTALLAGCKGGEKEPDVTPEEILNKIVETVGEDDLPQMTDIDDDALSTLYGIDYNVLEDYRGKTAMINVRADEFFVAKVKEGEMEAVEAGIAQRQEDLDATWSQYLPDVYETVKDARVVKNGSFILFVVSEKADDAVAVFDEMTKS